MTKKLPISNAVESFAKIDEATEYMTTSCRVIVNSVVFSTFVHKPADRPDLKPNCICILNIFCVLIIYDTCILFNNKIIITNNTTKTRNMGQSPT